jgi:hypothetical protein
VASGTLRLFVRSRACARARVVVVAGGITGCSIDGLVKPVAPAAYAAGAALQRLRFPANCCAASSPLQRAMSSMEVVAELESIGTSLASALAHAHARKHACREEGGPYQPPLRARARNSGALVRYRPTPWYPLGKGTLARLTSRRPLLTLDAFGSALLCVAWRQYAMRTYERTNALCGRAPARCSGLIRLWERSMILPHISSASAAN